MSTGIDIVKISRLEKFPVEKFAKKILSEEEQALPQAKNINSLAASFAAKEAFSKALGTGIRGFDLKDVSVMRNSLGKPFFVFSKKLEAILRTKGLISSDVSLTHEKEYALAVVNLNFDSHYAQYESAIQKFDTDIPQNTITPDIIRKILPVRCADMHKGDCGRCFIIAGSEGLTGAAILASRASVRCGAGLVTLGCPKGLNSIFESTLTEIMTLPLQDEDGAISKEAVCAIKNFSEKSDCILLGPGLSMKGGSKQITEHLISEYSKTLIVDADGINNLALNIDILKKHKADIILTPHPGEFAKLTGLSVKDILENPERHAQSFSEKYGVITVLKSHRTVIATPDGTAYVNILGNPGMATGGSGDVLAGCIASFVAQGFGAVNAALTGVYIHSLAADMTAFDKGEYGMLPSDVVENLPYAVKYSGGFSFGKGDIGFNDDCTDDKSVGLQ